MRCRVFLLGLILLSLFSCREQEVENEFIIGKEIEFKPNETFWSNNNQVSLKVLEINDSRCPLLYQCIWQGEARVKFRLTYVGTTTFELSTFFNPTDTIQNLAFRLVKVDPYPTGNEKIELKDYRVTVEIKNISD